MKKKSRFVYFLIPAIVMASVGCVRHHRNHANHLGKYSQRIKDISLSTRTDTISYALGSIWAMNLLKYGGLTRITNAFYMGVDDYLQKDSSLMTLSQASAYANKELGSVKSSKDWPVNNVNIRVSDIGLKNRFDTFSYALGYAWTRGAYAFGITRISPALLKGLSDRLYGKETLFKDFALANNYLMKYVDEVRAKKYAGLKYANEQWLRENARKEGVISLPDGVQYKILKKGHGPKMNIADNDVIETHYVSKLIDGTVYQDHTARPFKFYVFSALKGLHEVIRLMRPGDKWEIYIPYNLAYGSGGINTKVPSFSTLIVDLEILRVVKNP